MKKSKLIAGILLMILGLGVSIGSAVLRYHEHGRYGIINYGHKIVYRHSKMGGYGFGGFQNRPFNERPNQNQEQNSSTNPHSNQNQNNGQNPNGGAK